MRIQHISCIIVLFVCIAGCAFVQEKKLDAQACISDPVCFSAATAKAKSNGETAAELASLSGIPAAPTVAKPVVSYASLIILLCAMGATLRKNEA